MLHPVPGQFQRLPLPPIHKSCPHVSETSLPDGLVRFTLLQRSSKFPSLSLCRFPILHRRAPMDLVFADPVVTATPQIGIPN